jgi:hypothetical protein
MKEVIIVAIVALSVVTIVAIIAIFGQSNGPDYWTCDPERQEHAAKFFLKCNDELGSSHICTQRTKEIYCKPGYAPKDRKESKNVKEIISNAKSIIRQGRGILTDSVSEGSEEW